MKVAVLFTGYGSEYVGMGKDIYDQSRLMQEYFEEANNCLSRDFAKLCFSSTELDLSTAEIAYPTLFLVHAGIWALLKEHGLQPSVFAGDNLGAYTALYAAQGISFPDVLYLLNKYAVIYQEALATMRSVGIMRVTGIKATALQKLCTTVSKDDESACIAQYRSETEQIVSGTSGAIDALQELAFKAGAEIHELPIEYGLHSPLLDAAAQNFAPYLTKVDFKDMAIPVINTVTGKPLQTADDSKQFVIDLFNKPLNWQKTVQACTSADLIVYIGAQAPMLEALQAQMPNKKVIAITTWQDIETIKTIVQEQSTGLE
jgi:[acyl-carrier-protein] S-malonyltransferase